MEQNVKVVALKRERFVKFSTLPDGAWFIICDGDADELTDGSGLCVKMNNDNGKLNAYAVGDIIHTFVCPLDNDVRRVFPTITYYEE